MGNSLKRTLGVMSVVNSILDQMVGQQFWNTMEVDRENIVVRGQARDPETGEFHTISLHLSVPYNKSRKYGYIINGKRHMFDRMHTLIDHWNENYGDYYDREYGVRGQLIDW